MSNDNQCRCLELHGKLCVCKEHQSWCCIATFPDKPCKVITGDEE